MPFGSFAKRFDALTGIVTSQTTSVNPNDSFSMVREGSSFWPTGAYTITFRARLIDWANPNVFQCMFYANYGSFGGGSESVFYGRTDNGDLRLFEPSLGEKVFANGSRTEWLYIYITWDGNPANPVIWTLQVDNDAPVSFSEILGAASTPYRMQVFNDVYSEQLGTGRGATLIVRDGLMSPAEIVAQKSSYIPIDTSGGSGATVYAYYPMNDWTTAHLDQSGNGRNMTPTGTGITVIDSPY